MGRSIGSPTAGHLVGGSRLPDAPYLRVVPGYARGEVRWGLGSMIGMIDRAAQKVRKAHPDAVLNVGHISRQGGGEVDRHVSHESGRDADIGFFVRNVQGKPVYAEHFVAFRGDGTAPSWPGALFDDARNWALVRALVTDPQAHVTHIFVATPLRARLLAFASKSGATAELRERAAMAMVQPHGSLPHDDHFHVRISCPGQPAPRECVEVAVRKRPALVARVPVPRGRMRARAEAPVIGPGTPAAGVGSDTAAAKHGASPSPTKPRVTPTWPAPTAPVVSPPESSTSPVSPGSGASELSPSAGSMIPPPASLVVPQKVTPEGDSEAIDDVDGPM